jgi:hypothetical protein
MLRISEKLVNTGQWRLAVDLAARANQLAEEAEEETDREWNRYFANAILLTLSRSQPEGGVFADVEALFEPEPDDEDALITLYWNLVELLDARTWRQLTWRESFRLVDAGVRLRDFAAPVLAHEEARDLDIDGEIERFLAEGGGPPGGD